MKKLILVLFACSFTRPVFAGLDCLLEFDGDIYWISKVENIELKQGTTIDQITPYKAFNTATRKYEAAYAKVQYKVLVSTEVETLPATCKDLSPGQFDYDRQVAAVKFEASSETPIFGSPTDGANGKTIKAWALCKGHQLYECK